MSKYGECAVKSVQFCIKESASPVDAWEEITSQVFGKGTSSQKKGCPRTTFLGLCEEGYIKGITKGKYLLKEMKDGNKKYAIEAVKVLKRNPDLIKRKNDLWSAMTCGKSIAQNNQIEVIVSLNEKDLINL